MDAILLNVLMWLGGFLIGFGIASICKKAKTPKKNPYRPCILTGRQTRNKSERDLLKIFEPALRYPNAQIPLSAQENIKLPSTDEEIEALKKGLKYVWCDGYEDACWQERPCKYLGIRITDSFILHETIITNTWSDCVRLWKEKCQARYLLWEELMILNHVWLEVSEMRVKAHDAPLKDHTSYWYDTEARKESSKHMNRQGETFLCEPEDEACLMLAVV